VVRFRAAQAEAFLSSRPAFFRVGPDATLVPDPAAHSPWGPDMLHGRLLAGLAARAAELDGGEAGFRPVRITVDMFRAAPMEPVGVACDVVRAGRRVRAVQVSLTCAGQEVVRAAALLMRVGPQPGGRVWEPEPWSVPPPGDVARMNPVTGEDDDGPGFLEIRPLTPGGFDAVAQKRLWIRETRPLVDSEDPTPFVRTACAADLANPFSNSGEGGLHFINADLSVYLARPPVGEWIGLEVSGRSSADGVAVADANLYDEVGRVGQCAVASVATGAFSPPAP